MSLQKQQDFLARLFTDENLRRKFLSQPAITGAENGLSESETNDLQAVLPGEIGFFAESLFWKRLREAEKLSPLTKKVLKEEFTEHFREFSQNFNPQTVKKHLEDALGFCRFLQKQDVSGIAKNTAKFEQSKLEFFSGEKRFAVCRLNFDIREIYDRQPATADFNPEMKTKIAVWLKIGKKVKHFII